MPLRSRPRPHASTVCIDIQGIRIGCMQECSHHTSSPRPPSSVSLHLASLVFGSLSSCAPCLCKNPAMALFFAIWSRFWISSSFGSLVAPAHTWVYCNVATAMHLQQPGHITLSRASFLASSPWCLFCLGFGFGDTGLVTIFMSANIIFSSVHLV